MRSLSAAHSKRTPPVSTCLGVCVLAMSDFDNHMILGSSCTMHHAPCLWLSNDMSCVFCMLSPPLPCSPVCVLENNNINKSTYKNNNKSMDTMCGLAPAMGPISITVSNTISAVSPIWGLASASFFHSYLDQQFLR